ncbi:MAG: TMEM175 family protein [Eubacterium sp.]|nr:TMEM175 family protein [Eubacterium sp.]
MKIMHKGSRFYNNQSEENQKKLEHMYEKQAMNEERLKESIVSHLSALNDGVVAIYITIMVLSIPYPQSRADYSNFIWSIGTFIVSFFIIADFWYENKRTFETVKKASHGFVVMNFIYLASLALIPVTTSWILFERGNTFAEINFCIVYILTLICQNMLRFFAIKHHFKHHYELFIKLIARKALTMLFIAVVLIGLSICFPYWAVTFYILLPIVDFLIPEDGKHRIIKKTMRK